MLRTRSNTWLKPLLRVLALTIALLHAGAYAQGLLALADHCHCTHPANVPCDCPHMAASSGEDESKLPPCHRKLLEQKRAADNAQGKVRNRCAPPPIAAAQMPIAVLSEVTPAATIELPSVAREEAWTPVTEHTEDPAAPPPRS